MNDEYTREEKLELLKLARHTIENYIRNREKAYPETSNSKFLENRGVFVTLHKGKELKGCIGYPLPIKSLIHAVVDNAIAASSEDPRFNHVKLEELKHINIEISILTVPEEQENIHKIKIGRDGIIITKGYMRGLLLPQVPVEQGWNLIEYISYGCMKAGLPEDEWKRGVKVKTFQANVFNEKEMLQKK